MIRIVTDSSADLPPELAEQLGVSVVPLTIRFGIEEYVDGHDLTPDGFWQRMAVGDVLPETAAPAAGAFLDAFEELRAGGASGIVAICLSSALSGTYQSAVIAAEKAADQVPVRVVDSRSVSMALGLQVMAAARLASGGAGLEEIAAAALRTVPKTDVVAALDTLENLRRGGRMGGLQAVVGGILDIKPLLHLVDGVVAPAGRVRTRTRAIESLVAAAAAVAPDLEELAVVHSGAHDLDRLLAAVREAVPGHEPTVARLGPVVGTHAGPNALGIAYRTL